MKCRSNDLAHATSVVLALTVGSTASAVSNDESEAAPKNETLADVLNVGSENVRHSGFGAPVVKVGPFNNEGATLTGGRGAWLINDTVYFGGAGYGLASEEKIDLAGKRQELEFGYGGLMAGVNLFPEKLIHATALVTYGWGAVSADDDADVDDEDDDNNVTDNVNVVEPEALVEVNVTNFMRVGLGASYRLVTGVDEATVLEEKTDANGWTTTLAFNFGGF